MLELRLLGYHRFLCMYHKNSSIRSIPPTPPPLPRSLPLVFFLAPSIRHTAQNQPSPQTPNPPAPTFRSYARAASCAVAKSPMSVVWFLYMTNARNASFSAFTPWKLGTLSCPWCRAPGPGEPDRPPPPSSSRRRLAIWIEIGSTDR